MGPLFNNLPQTLDYWEEARIKSRLEGLTFPCLLKRTEGPVSFISKQCNSDFTLM
jgi:hypothetical protein